MESRRLARIQHHQQHMRAERGDGLREAAEVDGLAKAWFGPEQDALAGERLRAVPARAETAASVPHIRFVIVAPLEVGPGTREIADQEPAHCAVEMGRGIVRFDRKRAVEARQRLRQATEIVQRGAAADMRLVIVRVYGEGALIAGQGVGQPVEETQGAATFLPDLGLVGNELRGAIVARERLDRAVKAHQGVAEIEPGNTARGVDVQRMTDHLGGGGVVVALHLHNSRQVPGLDMPGRKREHVSVDFLGLRQFVLLMQGLRASELAAGRRVLPRPRSDHAVELPPDLAKHKIETRHAALGPDHPASRSASLSMRRRTILRDLSAERKAGLWCLIHSPRRYLVRLPNDTAGTTSTPSSPTSNTPAVPGSGTSVDAVNRPSCVVTVE